MTPLWRSSACVVPEGISSMWCVTKIVAGALGSCEKAEKRRNKSSLPPRSRPAVGDTHTFTVGILKDGKPQRKALTFSVYGMPSGNYELVAYIN